MALTQGSRLGPYEIIAPLGAVGMGEVYRAPDRHRSRSGSREGDRPSRSEAGQHQGHSRVAAPDSRGIPCGRKMSPQQTIAHYRITSKLGEGGMGEVWRATDTKLGREVAIKIIPEAFAQDADRMARFTREAQVLASLNHPNIAAIYGVEERALVMELVEGPTLAERI